MENKVLYVALDRYFKRLSQVGYIPDNSTFSILVLVYIFDMLKTYNLDTDQLGIIDRAISCLQRDCFIPYKSCKETCI